MGSVGNKGAYYRVILRVTSLIPYLSGLKDGNKHPLRKAEYFQPLRNYVRSTFCLDIDFIGLGGLPGTE